MILKIFYAFLILLTGYLAYNVYGLWSARHSLTHVPQEFLIGPEDADLYVTEFLNYSCTYCRETHPVIMEAIKQDGHIAYAPRPLLSEDIDASSAAYILYAAAKQGKLEDTHHYLMTIGQNYSKERIAEIAGELGIEAEQFEQDLNSKESKKFVMNNLDHATKLGVYATPTFFIGPDIFYIADEDMPSVEDFLKLFAEARALQRGETPPPATVNLKAPATTPQTTP